MPTPDPNTAAAEFREADRLRDIAGNQQALEAARRLACAVEAALPPAREEHGTLAALRLAEAALVDLYACDREDCTEPNCNHALVAVRAALRQHATPPIAGCEVCADVPPELLARWP